MKKAVLIIAALCAALLVAGCASAPPAGDSMADARRSAPDNTLVGQATGSDAKGAEDDAKYQLVRGMAAMVKDMVDDAVAAKALDSGISEQFRQAVNTALTKINVGAVKQGSGEGKGKVFWAVYYMEKGEVIKAINQAVAAGKSAFPAAATFAIEGRIDKAFAAQASKEWKKN